MRLIKPLDNRLKQYAKEQSMRLGVIQQDYLLSWLLVGLSQITELRDNLIFKGGTALKKCYFGQYRFSEDLDFTALTFLSPISALIEEAIQQTQQLMQEYAPIIIRCEQYHEKKAHPEGQEAFKIRAQFPKQREPLVSAMIEITFDEILVTPPVERKTIHGYEEIAEAALLTYSLEEIVMEKLRGILQKTKKSHERSWTRSRARDYYDLWNIFRTYQQQLDSETIRLFLPKKCQQKMVSFNSIDDFFDPIMIEQTIKDWDLHLKYLVSDLPEFNKVQEELYNEIDHFI